MPPRPVKRTAGALSPVEDQNEGQPYPTRSQNANKRSKRTSSRSENNSRNKKQGGSALARLEKQAEELRQKIAQERSSSNITGEYNDLTEDSEGGLSPESEDDFVNDIISFTPASTITAMETIVTPTPTTTIPRLLNLRRVHRQNTGSDPKTPRHAFMFSPVVDEGLEQEDLTEMHPSTPTLSLVPFTAPTSSPTPMGSSGSNTPSTMIGAQPLQLDLLPRLAYAGDHKPGGKEKADHYDSEGKAIILHANAYYEAKILGVQGFPKSGTKIAWAKKAFQDGSRVARKRYQSDKHIEQLIYSRGSRIRGETLRHIEEAIISVFGFSKDSSRKTQSHNLGLYNHLSQKMAFAFKDTVKHTGFAENPVFQHILRLVCFGNGDSSRGIVFARFFNPVSLETLALFMTQVHYLMRQWSTGSYERHGRKEAFTEASYSKVHSDFLQELQKWEALNPSVVMNIRKRMYSRARAKSAIDPPEIRTVITGELKTRMVSELAGRTGETDTEEEQDEGDGTKSDEELEPASENDDDNIPVSST